MAEWFLFLPQVRMSIADVVERAAAAEVAGFDGIALIDHLEAPGAEGQPIWEAMTLATWVAARTARIRIGHLVLCDGFRHPAVLAKQAVTLSAASQGRFELGLGSGSWPAEFARFGIPDGGARARVARLGEHLALLRRHWGETGDDALTQVPRPAHRIPLVLGGTGPTMLALVREYADWWNVPCHQLDRLSDLSPHAGAARVSVQQMVGFVRRGADRNAVTATAQRRFSHLGAGLVCGDATELSRHFAAMSARGVERFYVWFADFAPPDTLAAFADTVIAHHEERTS
ncbi:LLM class flavin-dependent oxidoreductase [Mycobacterium sp. MYCO198283]|uniref:LLM class flavin-dependent oxidoreductase n=1 Tax=Mycobacterium sp. MYCO198283 TaxID=2883505 RepID=UPI001E395D51|nr:LLM class flavin-dependent oxidoreductase [Mycobacterium sp. MYCO198283]MCG5433684.1 LLM class flavin-dependent oxidoreductase [Mycobacterium sp. MYCO198283]